MQLVGLDGNAFALMGAFSKNARRQGWTKEEIDKVITEATSNDYDHLVATLWDNVIEPDEEEEEEEE